MEPPNQGKLQPTLQYIQHIYKGQVTYSHYSCPYNRTSQPQIYPIASSTSFTSASINLTLIKACLANSILPAFLNVNAAVLVDVRDSFTLAT